MQGQQGVQRSASSANDGRSTKMNEEKPKVLVIMGPTGSGKSKLAIDLGSYFPIEVINADSMQVYHGLDVLTNKVPLNEQKGVAHHLLGTVSPNIEFTAKQFRDSAISLINDILSRNCLPVIVGGTNYYIQALVSPFLLDDTAEDIDEDYPSISPGDEQPCYPATKTGTSDSYKFLEAIDPVAANRIHPNNNRKISQYLGLYSRTGVQPSKILRGKAAENWGRLDNFRYDCCFISMDASLPVLDRYVEKRVDRMVEAGLLDEVVDIFDSNVDYTRGLRQAIGVREFENIFRAYNNETRSRCDLENHLNDLSASLKSLNMGDKFLKENIREILNSDDSNPKILIKEAIDRVKLNTRRLVRRQKRGLNRLETLFRWDIHYLDATESISSKSDEIWEEKVVQPAAEIIRSFLNQDACPPTIRGKGNGIGEKIIERDLWTQYICKACGDRVLRGAHEWEQHVQGRGHRKRISRLRKSQALCLKEDQQQQDTGWD